MKKAVGYIRVSTRHQERKGCGLEAQEAAIRAFARSGDYELVGIHQDVFTAKGPTSITRRPGLKAAIDLANKTEAVILLWNGSRISRDVDSFMASKIKIPDVVEVQIAGRNGLEARIARAKVEADHLHKRTTEGMARAKRRGAAFGNRSNLAEAREKGVVANIQRAKEFSKRISEVISRYRAMGLRSHAELASALNVDGHLTPYGKAWTKENIRNTLKRIDAGLTSGGSNQTGPDMSNHYPSDDAEPLASCD